LLIAETSIDLSENNNGFGYLPGQGTFAGLSLTHEEPLYISQNYRVELTDKSKPAGEFAFSIIPPLDAISTIIKSTEFAKGVTAIMDPIEAKKIFGPSDNVFFIGNGILDNSLGCKLRGSQMEISWSRRVLNQSWSRVIWKRIDFTSAVRLRMVGL